MCIHHNAKYILICVPHTDLLGVLFEENLPKKVKILRGFLFETSLWNKVKIEVLSEEVSRMIFQLVTIILHRDFAGCEPKMV